MNLRTAYVTVNMPYDPIISVNSAYVRNNPRLGHRKRVDQWLTAFKIKFNAARGSIGKPIGNVRMDITIYRRARRGRLPDTSNMRKLPQDLIASVLEVDDCHFYGEDRPIVSTPNISEDVIMFDFVWEYEIPSVFVYNPTHKMSMGPMYPTLMRRYSIKKGDVCIGFGSAYCMKCSAAPEDCPVQFNPSVYTEDNCPCAKCDRECPCKGTDPEYEERRKDIEIWWAARLASQKFESKHWGK